MDWLRFGRGLYLSAACLFGDPLMKIVVEVVWPAYRYSRAVVPGFVIAHDNFGINCLDETIRVNVIDTISGNPYYDYSGQLIIDTGTGFGSWSLLTGSGGFSDPAADGMAGYVWPLGEDVA